MNQTEVVKVLLARKAPVNATNKNGETPLHLAAIEDQIDSAELLLDGKIAVNVKDNLGNSPLNDAQQKGYKDMEALLRKHGGH
jgi:ankyrin repeat protein